MTVTSDAGDSSTSVYGDVDDQNDTWIKYSASPGVGGYFDVDTEAGLLDLAVITFNLSIDPDSTVADDTAFVLAPMANIKLYEVLEFVPVEDDNPTHPAP